MLHKAQKALVVSQFKLVVLLLGASGAARAEGARFPGFVDINAYPILTETRSDNYLTVLAFLKLSDRLHYFSLNNLGTRKGVDGAPDKSVIYTEQSIRWQINKDCLWI